MYIYIQYILYESLDTYTEIIFFMIFKIFYTKDFYLTT